MNEALEKFHGVVAPAWADDHVLAEILRQEADDERDWFGTDRDKALLLTAADRIDRLDSEVSALLRSIKDQEAMHVEISDLRTTILDLVLRAEAAESERGAIAANLRRIQDRDQMPSDWPR